MAKPIRWDQELIDRYVKKGYWENNTLYDLWERNARDFPDREAVADSDLRLTWKQAMQWIDRLALGFFDLGLKRDDMIVIQLPNSSMHILLRVACEKAGILCLPALRSLRHIEMVYVLSYSEAVGVVIPLEFRDFNY